MGEAVPKKIAARIKQPPDQDREAVKTREAVRAPWQLVLARERTGRSVCV